MLDKIYAYAMAHPEIIRPGYLMRKKIGGYIKLDHNGEYKGFDYIENATEIIVPAMASINVAVSNIVIEKYKLVLNVFEEGQSLKSKTAREKDYMEKVMKCADLTSELDPVATFLNEIRKNTELRDTVVNDIVTAGKMKNDTVSFKIDGRKIEEIPEIVDAIAETIPKNEDTVYGISSVTGEYKQLITSPIKFKTPFGYDTSLAPFSLSPSTNSYGLSASTIARIGDDEKDAIKSGLETLLSPEHYNLFFRMIHWYDEDNEDEKLLREILGEIESSEEESDSEEDVTKALSNDTPDERLSQSLKAARELDASKLKPVPDNSCNIAFCYAPLDSRYVLYGYRQWNASKVTDNILSCREKARIYRGKNGTIKNLRSAIYGLLPNATIDDKEKYLRNMFGNNIDNLVCAVLDGKQIPEIFMTKSTDIVSDYITYYKHKESDPRYTLYNYLAAMKFIQLYLSEKEEFMQTNAYYLGKAYAIYEKLQDISTGGKSVANQFAAARQRPQLVIPRVAGMSKHHIKKLEEKDQIIYTRMLNEVYKNVTEIPEKLDRYEQASFVLGYYHESKMLLRENKKENKEENKENEGETSNE